MSTNIINVPQGFASAKLPTAFHGVGGGDDISAGITGGFGIITYKGKVWRTKYLGEETVLLAEDGRNARPELEVIIVKAAQMISKVFYADGYEDGSTAPPDCWSVNGIVPDAAASKKQSTTCAGCPKNACGSRVTESGKQGKACSDNKRLVVVPAADIRNETLGGPMMLRVPPASLQDMATFGKMMESKGFPYYSFVTRLRFDPNEAFPKFIFEPVRPLSEEEAKLVIEARNNPITQRILEAPVTEVQHDTTNEQAQLKSPTDLFNPIAAAKAAQMAATATGQPQPVVTQPKPAQAPAAQPAAGTVIDGAGRVRPRFDPQTGQPIVYADEQPPRPRFDPQTGQPIVYPDEQPAQQAADPLEIPEGLRRTAPKKEQPVVAAQPETVASPPSDAAMKDFDAALDGLLGAPKK